MINRLLVNRYSSFPFLGVELDERMSWENHIDTICGKVGSGIGIIKRVKPSVPSETLQNLFNSLVITRNMGHFAPALVVSG